MKNIESTFPFIQEKRTRMEMKAEDYHKITEKVMLMIEKNLLSVC